MLCNCRKSHSPLDQKKKKRNFSLQPITPLSLCMLLNFKRANIKRVSYHLHLEDYKCIKFPPSQGGANLINKIIIQLLHTETLGGRVPLCKKPFKTLMSLLRTLLLLLKRHSQTQFIAHITRE